MPDSGNPKITRRPPAASTPARRRRRATPARPVRNRLKVVSAEEEFWAARPVLHDVWLFAKARRVAPWGMLGVCLTRAVSAAPPFYVLPKIIGTEASLNLFTNLVGPSGLGKNASEGAAQDFLIPKPCPVELDLGSGEGINKAFAYYNAKEARQANIRDTVHFSVPEIDSLSALKDRSGSTLMAQLRKAWSGQRLGMQYADVNRNIKVEPHRYRMTAVIGVQPLRAENFLQDADGGTPQRFLWFSVRDPEYDRSFRPEEPAPLILPEWPGAGVWEGAEPPLDVPPDKREFVLIGVPKVARDYIDERHELQHASDDDAGLDGHAGLVRLKTAAALMALDGRHEAITEEDWELSGYVQQISDRTRHGIVARLEERAADNNRKRGEEEGIRRVHAVEASSHEMTKRAAEAIRRALAKTDVWVAGGRLKSGLKAGTTRDHYDAAIQALLDTGAIEERPARKGGAAGKVYRLVQPST